MISSVGPRRLVLIRSAGYDYADLELDAPLHLVAPNNAGKTSLIAALQFLFIDQLNRMHFSHSTTDTKRHYFPESNSFVLFECETPTGYQVFAARGLGPARGFDFDRLVYRGEYRREDFIEGRRVRAWDEIRARLHEHDLDKLEARDLRQSLVGGTTNGRAPLGILPLRRSASYESFHLLFRNLLRLSRLSQEELKDLFIDGAGIDPRVRRVDLRQELSGPYETVAKHLAEIEDLRRVKPHLDLLIQAFDARARLRNELVARWGTLEAAIRAETLRLESIASESQVRAAGLQADIERKREDQQTADVALTEATTAAGRLRGALDRLDIQAKSFEDYNCEFEQHALTELQRRRDRKATRLAQGIAGDRGRLERRRVELTRDVARDELLVGRHAEALVTWLRHNCTLGGAALADVFRVVDPALLAQIVAPGGIEIEDAAGLDRTLRAIADAFTDGDLVHPVLTIRSAALRTDDPLAPFEDIEAVKSRITADSKELCEISERLADLDRIESLRREVAELDRQLGERRHRQTLHGEWQGEEQQRDTYVAELEMCVAARAEHATRRDELQSAIEATLMEQRECITAADAADRRLRELRQYTSELSEPPPEWPRNPQSDGEPSPDRDAKLADLLEAYVSGTRQQRLANARYVEAGRDVETKTAGRYRRATEEGTITALRDELKALPDHEATVQKLWSGVVEGLKSRFRSLLDGIDTLAGHIGKLNGALRTRKISNLERVEVRLVRQEGLLGKLRAVVDVDEMPLLAAAGGRHSAYEDVARWLEDRPELDLQQLFGLRFRVVDRSGTEKVFDSLSQIESQGTSTTIKVLVHLELLRMLLADKPVTMPFFLDEVATLDDANLRALIEHATAMGFVPIVASPEARDCVERLYFLMPTGGDLVLDETARVKWKRRDDRDE